MLSRVKQSFADLRIGIMRMSETSISETLIQQLLSFVPDEEEQAILSENIDKFESLGKAEQFYIEVRQILDQRLVSQRSSLDDES
jgi:hypothetical protein